MAAWVRTFREGIRPEVRQVINDVGLAALDDLNLPLSFDLSRPEVIRFLEGRSQRFAREVNQTTWFRLRISLAEGIDAGESTEELARRVEGVMADRIASSAETIARTEVNGASNGGTLLAWNQTDVVKGKTWLAALDERTRETHVQAHGQEVALDADFQVGDGAGPAPGQIGLPEEDINCRCAMSAVLDMGER
jgi:SPP1 gp7 family putative phage head morphogenesis protein